jgi:hypothetical protein
MSRLTMKVCGVCATSSLASLFGDLTNFIAAALAAPHNSRAFS